MYQEVIKKGVFWSLFMIIGFKWGVSQEEGLIVNEVGLSGSKFIELIVYSDDPCEFVDLRGWIVDDNNGEFLTCIRPVAGTGISSGHIKFADNTLWRAVPSGMILLLYDGDNFKIGDLCLGDWVIDINVNGGDGFDPYFEINSNDPHASDQMGTPCINRTCNPNDGEIGYTNSYTNLGSGLNFSTGSPLGFNLSHDGVQTRTENGDFYHGFSWGSPDNGGCPIVQPQFDGGPYGLHFPIVTDGVSLFSDGYQSDSEFRVDQDPSPGEANSLDNANWIADLRRPPEGVIRAENVNCVEESIIGRVTIPISEDSDCVPFLSEIPFNWCIEYDFTWSLEPGSEEFIELISDQNSIPPIDIQGLKAGTAYVRLNLVDKFFSLYPDDDSHNIYNGDFLFEVTIESFEASLEGNFTELCENNCAEIIFKVEEYNATETYSIDYNLNPYGEDYILSIPGNQIIQVCLDTDDPAPIYDDVNHILHLPKEDAGEDISLQLLLATQNSNDYCGIVDDTPVAFVLSDGLMPNAAPTISGNAILGISTVDLTSVEGFIANGTSVFNWFFDSLGVKNISKPDSFLTEQLADTVFVQVSDGTCQSTLMPVFIMLQPEISGDFEISLDSITYYCDDTGMGLDTTIIIQFPDDMTLFDYRVVLVIDGDTSYMQGPGSDSIIISLNSILDSALIYVDSIDINGGGDFFTGQSDTVRIYVDNPLDLSMIPETINTCSYFIIPDYTPGFDSLIILQNLINLEVNPGDTVYTDDFLVYSFQIGSCFDLVIQDIFIDQPKSAGIAMDSTFCLTSLPDSIFLFDFLSGSYDVDGIWEQKSVSLVDVSSSNSFATLGLQQEIYSFQYIVTGPTCEPDTACVELTFSSVPFAGYDTMYTTRFQTLNLNTFFPARNQNGSFFLDGMQIDSNLSTSTLMPGEYSIFHRIDDPLCGMSEAELTLTVIPCAMAGRDTLLTFCNQAKLVPEEFILDGDGGGSFFYQGNVISRSDSFVIENEGTYELYYLVNTGAGCSPAIDSATIHIVIEGMPFAGSDTSYITRIEVLNLFSFFPDRNQEGTLYLDGMQIDSNLSTSTLMPGEYSILHRIDDPLCGMDEAELTLTIVPCAIPGLDTMLVSCDSIKIVPSELLNGADPGGVFIFNGSGIPNNDSLVINTIGISTLYYVVGTGVGCVPSEDTATLIIEISAPPISGRDTAYTTSVEVLDLYSFFPDRSADGNFSLEGIASSSTLSTDSLLSGTYNIIHRLGNTECGESESLLTLTIVPCAVAGLDTSLVSCEATNIVPENFIRIGDSGGWFSYNGSLISGNVGLDINSVGTDSILYIVDSGTGCIPTQDTAIISVTILDGPDAGRDTMAMLTGGMIDLYDYFPESSRNGYFFFSNDPITTISNTLDIDLLEQGSYEIAHVVEDVLCPSDTAFLNLEIVSCLSAGRDTSIQTCRNALIDLTSLTSSGGGKDYYLEGAQLSNPSNFDPNTVLGDIANIQVVQSNTGCANDTIEIEIAIDDAVDLPSDVNVTRCGPISITLNELAQGIPLFDPDHFAYGAMDNVDINGDTTIAALPLDLFQSVTVMPGEKKTLSYIVRPLFCPADTVHYTIVPMEIPDAGTDTILNYCDNDLIDLTFNGAKSANFRFELNGGLLSDPEAFDLGSVPDNMFQVFVIDSTSVCGIDTAFINIEKDNPPLLPQDTIIAGCGSFLYTPFGAFSEELGVDSNHILYGALDSVLANGDTIIAVSPFIINLDPSPIFIEEGETRIFSYIVQSPFCGSDTLNHILKSSVSENAGRDTSVVVTLSIIDLTTLVPGRSGDGIFELVNTGDAVSSLFDPKNYMEENLSIYHIVSSSNCANDTARIDLTIIPCPGSGLDSTLIVCGPTDFRPFTLLRDAGAGEFYRDGNLISPSELITIEESDSIELFFITMADLCPKDSARLFIKALPIPDAGRDTALLICGGTFLLETLIDSEVSSGQLYDQNDELVAPGSSFDANQGNGSYEYYFVVNSEICPADTASYSITVTSDPSAGLDTVIVNCGIGIIIPQVYIREGDNGVFLFEDKLIPGDTTLTFVGSVNTTIRHFIPAAGGCSSDTAYFQIVNEPIPEAGMDFDTIICTSQIINLASFIENGNPGGTFFDETGSEIDSMFVIDGFGRKQFRYVVDLGFCGTDNALFFIDNYDLSNTNVQGVTESICAQEQITVTLPDLPDVITFELTIRKNNLSSGVSEVETIIVNPGSAIDFYHTSGGINPFFDLGDDAHYSIIFESALFSSGCDVVTGWDSLDIVTAINSEYLYTEILCGGEERIIGGIVFNENNPSGTAILENASANGCDSIILVELDFDNFAYGDFVGQLCQGDELFLNGTLYSASNLNGVDTLFGASVNGCDSILTVRFEIVNTKVEIIEETFCGEAGSVTVNGVLYDINNPVGIQMIPGGSASGCDSMVEVKLVFLPIGLNDINLELCDTDYSTTINGTLYNFENRRGRDLLPGAAASGCDSIIDVNLVFVELFYEYEVLSPPCPGDSIGSVEITSWEGSLPAVISWDNIEINLDALPFSFGFPINEQFILEIRDEDGCNGSQLINIMEREPIELETISTDLGGNTYELEVISSDEIAEYKWYPELNLSCVDCPNPVITLNDNDQFLYVDIITTGGCMVSDTIYLGFNVEDIVYAPTIFSPNQDGNNDTWTLYASPESDLIFKDTYIYDRWGKLVKILPSETINNLNLGWDGGEHLPGVYVYRLEYEDRSGQSRILSGDFTLIR